MLLNDAYVELPRNRVGRDLLVGDIHGQMGLLDCVLAAAQFNPARDRLIALGDLIDRGPDSARMLSRLAEEPSFISLLGNHDAMMWAAGRGNDTAVALWRGSGGDWAESLSEATFSRLASHLEGMPLAIELPLADGRRIGLVHAEVPSDHEWSDVAHIGLDPWDVVDETGALSRELLWGRERVMADRMIRMDPQCADTPAHVAAAVRRSLAPVRGIDRVFAGHSPMAVTPWGRANCLWMDTRCFRPEGRLTLVDPLAEAYWQAGWRQGTEALVHAEPQPLPLPDALPTPWQAPVWSAADAPPHSAPLPASRHFNQGPVR